MIVRPVVARNEQASREDCLTCTDDQASLSSTVVEESSTIFKLTKILPLTMYSILKKKKKFNNVPKPLNLCMTAFYKLKNRIRIYLQQHWMPTPGVYQFTYQKLSIPNKNIICGIVHAQTA